MQDFKFPYALDKATNKSSATLFFAYISYWLTFTLIVVFAVQESLGYALIASFVLFLITIYIYRARKLDGLKISKSGFEIASDSKPSNGKDSEEDNDAPAPTTSEATDSKPEGWGNASAKTN